MVLTAALVKRAFETAAKDDPSLLKAPRSALLDRAALEDVMSPVGKSLSQTAYGEYSDNLSLQIKTMRQMCVDAFAAVEPANNISGQNRAELSNVLQSLFESVKSSENSAITVDYNVPTQLMNLRPTMLEAADILNRTLHNSQAAQALQSVVSNIEYSHARYWRAAATSEVKTIMDAPAAANDAQYALEA